MSQTIGIAPITYSSDSTAEWVWRKPMEMHIWPYMPANNDGVSTDIEEPKKEEKKTVENKGARYLFRVTVVDPRTDGIILDGYKVIAGKREEALIKVPLPQEVREHFEDYDMLIEQVGELRAKKEVQKVRVIKTDED